MNLRMWGSHYTQLLQLREPLSYVTVNIRIGPLLCSHTCMVRLLFTEQLPEPSYRGLWREWLMLKLQTWTNQQPAHMQSNSFHPPRHTADFICTILWLDLCYVDLICAPTTEKPWWWLGIEGGGLRKGMLKSDLQQLDLSWYTHNCTRHKTCTNTSRDKALVYNGIALFFWEEMQLLSDKNFTWGDVLLYIKM